VCFGRTDLGGRTWEDAVGEVCVVCGKGREGAVRVGEVC